MKNTARKSPARARPASAALVTSLAELLGRLSDARAVIETACRAMENGDDYTVEMSALRTGLKMLDEVYDELDLAITTLSPPLLPEDTT